MEALRKTVLHDRHIALGAKMVEFGGWEMPVQYPTGIVEEHLLTRREAGLFDVSHMGRLVFRGAGAIQFLQHALTNNAAALDVGQAHYTMIPNARGGAVDDAYLYRFLKDQYLLVVNAANRQKDIEHFKTLLPKFRNVEMADRSEGLAMISLQGPRSKEMLFKVVDGGKIDIEPRRNSLAVAAIRGRQIMVGRTGYTGEPICFELFVPREAAGEVWDMLVAAGAHPVGLGARDTLRLEAGLPLYGHELGRDPEGKEIPIMACPLARFAVSFSPLKGDYVGREQLARQYEAMRRFAFGDYSLIGDLPRTVMPLALLDKTVARAGASLHAGARAVGFVTSGTMVPLWRVEGEGLASRFTDEKGLRAIALALVDSDLRQGDVVDVEVRGRRYQAQIVPHHLRSEAPPYARPVVCEPSKAKPPAPHEGNYPSRARKLLDDALANHLWRQRECINLIPSEMTLSPMARMLSITDPAFRYAEHKPVKAFDDAEVFYYQGTDFIERVESLLAEELCAYMGCSLVETRVISGQMANTVVFGAIVDYLNRANRRAEPRRLRKVMNNGIFRGGHLSAQPMGALHDFVARDARTELPAVVNFPVMVGNPYRIDVSAAAKLIEEHKPELVILGKSLVLHPEPVKELREAIDGLGLPTLLMYDMAHVLGLVGPHFQQPFKEGADIVTGSTHKTFFGTQRGIVAAEFAPNDVRRELWEAVNRRAFPGAVSNHHLGTLVGLLMAAYEMNYFKDQYQTAVLANAKRLARSLKDCGLDVAGDPAVSYTETHQVVLYVGYGRGPEIARRLEDNNIIVNYQAGPWDEGFSAASGLRMGVAEMTRFGMGPSEMDAIAELIREVVARGLSVVDKVKALRGRFTELKYCFGETEFDNVVQRLHGLV
ncbi:MAG: glycine cleavage system aminomethyltransferase GcvT [Phycisphaerae bacterium]